MASYEQALAWINQKTDEIKSKKYSKNHVHIVQSMRSMELLEREVKDWKSKVDSISVRTFDASKKKTLLSSFDCLKELIVKTKHCLETMRDVSQLEENVIKLSNNFDKRSTFLSTHHMNNNNNNNSHKNNTQNSCNDEQHTTNITGFIASSAQDCIFGLRDNWDWVAESVRCSLVHLKNAADYHKFFHEVEECEQWLNCDLKKFKDAFERSAREDHPGDSEGMIREIDSVNTSLRQWEVRITRLWNESTKLLPIPVRVDPISTPCPGHVLADYETAEISVRNSEEILLLDNTNPDRWKVRNGKGQEGFVPPIIVIVPGPDQKCIDAADKLRLHLLATWTNLLKRVGVRLICYTLAVFKPDYSQKEINALKAMNDFDKEKMMRVLSEVEGALKKYWADHEGFVNIQERISALRLILEEFGDESSENHAKVCQSMMSAISALGQVIQIYQELNSNWEKFKVSVEASKSPELMMIVDKWEQLQFVSKDYFSKFWKMKLPLDEKEKKLMSARSFTLEGIQFEDTIDMTFQNSPRPQSAHVTTIPQFTFSTPQIKLTSLDDKIQFKIGVPLHNSTPSVDESDSYSTTSTVVSKQSFPTIRFTVDLHAQGSPDRSSVHEESYAEEKRVVYGGPSDGRQGDRSNFIETRVYEKRFGSLNSKSNSMNSLNNLNVGNVNSNNGNLHAGVVSDAVDHLFHHMSATSFNDSGCSMSRTQVNEVSNVANHVASGSYAKTGRGFNFTANLQAAESPSQTAKEFGYERSRTAGRTSKFSEDSTDSMAVLKRNLSHAGEGESANERWSSGDDSSLPMSMASGSDYEGTAFGIATETKTAETEQLSSAEMEENKTFVIGSVLNTADGSDISLQQAILLGVIRPSEGVYVDLKSGKRIPIVTAMADGLIRVMHCRTKRSQEKFSSIGIITIKTVREMLRPYTVLWVRDSATGEEVEPREAVQRGILDEKQGNYVDKKTGETIMLVDAAEKGLAKIEYSGGRVTAPEVVVKTYAVRAVVDRKLKKTVTFHDAIKRGLIDKESGAFKDTVTGERMYVGDAIMRGFLKARQIEDASGLNIDPANKMVIDKTQTIKNKILKPLQVISAFKAAARRPGSASRPGSACGEKSPASK